MQDIALTFYINVLILFAILVLFYIHKVLCLIHQELRELNSRMYQIITTLRKRESNE